MRRFMKRFTAGILACSMLFAMGAIVSPVQSKKAKKPVLAATKKTVYVGKTYTLKVKKNGTKKIVKTKWKASNSKIVSLSKKKSTSVKIKAKKTGTAKITATVSYQRKGKKKTYKTKCTCTITTKIKKSVATIRTENVAAAVTNYESMAKLAEKYGFKFGTVINYNSLSDSYYKKLIPHHFNSLTAGNEFKAYSLLNQGASRKSADGMPVMDYSKADEIIEFARDNGIKMRGHTLVWHAYMSDWFFREGYDTSKGYVGKEVMQQRLKYYIENVLTHFETKYPGVIYCWDVVNEAVGDSAGDAKPGDENRIRTNNQFYKIIGADYVEQSFKYAKDTLEKLNSNVKLYYNDYNAFHSDKRTAICNLVKSINSYEKDTAGNNRKLCDGVGMQGYIGGYGKQPGCMNDNDIASIKQSIETYAGLGVEVQLTEMAVRNYVKTSANVTKHAEFYGKLFQMFVQVNSGETKPLTGVSIWGLFDRPDATEGSYEYSMNSPYGGLFNENYGVKNSFIQAYNVLKNS